MSQNNASDYDGIAVAVAGAKVDARYDLVTSLAAEGAVPFGVAVKRGTDPEKQCEVIDADTDTFLGVALHTHTVVTPTGGTPQYADEDTVSIMNAGAVHVEVTSAVAAGAAAYVDVSNGKFTDVATDNLAVPGGTFLTAAAQNGLAQLEIK